GRNGGSSLDSTIRRPIRYDHSRNLSLTFPLDRSSRGVVPIPQRRWEMTMFTRGIAAVLAVLFAVAGLAGSAAAQDKPRNGGELLFPVPSEPPSYDGHREETFGLIHPFAPFYNTLIRIDPTDPSGTKPVPSLAESWTASKDGKTYTFKLHKGVKFHDGSEMTSKDVKASYDKIIFPPPG